MTPAVPCRGDVSSVSDIRVSAQSWAKTLSPLRASWNPHVLFSECTLSPVARAAKRFLRVRRVVTYIAFSLEALSPKLSTQSHGRLVQGQSVPTSREKHIPNLPRRREVEDMGEDSEAAVGIRQAYQLAFLS